MGAHTGDLAESAPRRQTGHRCEDQPLLLKIRYAASGETREISLNPRAGGGGSSVPVETLRGRLAEKLGAAASEVHLLHEGTLLADRARLHPRADSARGTAGGGPTTVHVNVAPGALSQRELRSLVDALEAKGQHFELGLSDEEVEKLEARLSIRFPPDLRSFLQHRLPVSKLWTPWRKLLGAPADRAALMSVCEDGEDENGFNRFDVNMEGNILFDVKHNDFWMQEWGECPDTKKERLALARRCIRQGIPAAMPHLIPILSTYYMSSEPHAAGQPVMYLFISGTDFQIVGRDFLDWLAKMFDIEPIRPRPPKEHMMKIPFWSRVEEVNREVPCLCSDIEEESD